MIKRIFLILIIAVLPSIIFAQNYCIPNRFDTTYYFSSQQIEVIDNIQYGQNINYSGQNEILESIIAYPNFKSDTLSKRPFILLIPGGGFIAGNRYQLAPVMMDFAQRGYVCASINYRLGWNLNGDPFSCQGDGTSLAKAVYRAMQDAKAALRYFTANAKQYGIDTNYIFCGGVSAGAVTSLLISFLTQENMNALYPGFVNVLGPLNTATNNLTNSFSIKCILSSSGGINDTSYINQSNAVPVIMFHGTSDPNIPYATGNVYGCVNYLRTFGASDISKRLKNLRKPYELNYVPGGGHENFYPIDYIPKRAAIFLKRFLCDDSRQIKIENFTQISNISLGHFNEALPDGFALYQNYPNPFNPSTTIMYYMPDAGNISIRIYDLGGRQISAPFSGFQEEGFHTYSFNASGLASGLYFYSVFAGNSMQTRKMLFLK